PPPPPTSTLFPYTTLFRSLGLALGFAYLALRRRRDPLLEDARILEEALAVPVRSTDLDGDAERTLTELLRTDSPNGSARLLATSDRKSTRLNSSHLGISYA